MPTKKLLDRAEILEGMAGRVTKQASTLVVLIESRTAYFVAQAQQAMNDFLTETALAERNRAYLEAIALGREPPVPPPVQALERYAPQWAALVPDNPNLRAAVAHWLGEKYRFTYRHTPQLRMALGLDLPAVQKAYQRLYARPLTAIFIEQITLWEQLRWLEASVAAWLENLAPFWTAFALVLTETVGAGILALPIALARIGPLAGVVILLILGLVNVATIAAITEAIARNGQVRYGQVYFGRLVADYLGGAGSFILTLALFMLYTLMLIAYYIGFGLTLADATANWGGLSAPVWVTLLFVVQLYFLSRKNLNSTVTSALIVGAVNIVLILLLSMLALPHWQLTNLAYVNLPLFNGRPFDGALLELIFGVILLAYFGHTSTGNCARVVLRRDPSARSLIWGSMAATFASIGLYSLWVLAVNGAVAPQSLAQESGTALVPLAARVGFSVRILGAIFATLSMGLASVHMALGLFYLTQERLPKRTHGIGKHSNFLVAVSPILLLFLLTEWLLLTGRESFTKPLSFTGAITATLVGGIFPILLLVASRRKGEYAPGWALQLLGQPFFVALLYLLFLGSLLLHGLVIWQNPLERIIAVGVSLLIVMATVVMVRRGSFKPRLVVEVRKEQKPGGQASFTIMDNAKPTNQRKVDAQLPTVQLYYRRNEQTIQGESGVIPNFAALRRILFHLPATAAQEVKIWTYQITPEGDAVGLPTHVTLQQGESPKAFDLPLPAGQLVLALMDPIQWLEVSFREASDRANRIPSQ